MSSERAGTPTVGICGTQMRNTPRRNIICDLPAGHAGWHSAPDYEAMQPGVLQVVPRIDWAERAGVHTGEALDREKAREALERYGLGYLDHEPAAAVLDALEACVVPDPRLARIEALCNAATQELIDDPQDVGSIVNDMSLEAVRGVLRGEWG